MDIATKENLVAQLLRLGLLRDNVNIIGLAASATHISNYCKIDGHETSTELAFKAFLQYGTLSDTIKHLYTSKTRIKTKSSKHIDKDELIGILKFGTVGDIEITLIVKYLFLYGTKGAEKEFIQMQISLLEQGMLPNIPKLYSYYLNEYCTEYGIEKRKREHEKYYQYSYVK